MMWQKKQEEDAKIQLFTKWYLHFRPNGLSVTSLSPLGKDMNRSILEHFEVTSVSQLVGMARVAEFSDEESIPNHDVKIWENSARELVATASDFSVAARESEK